jgi:2-methylcitrate dehydratase PrpD
VPSDHPATAEFVRRTAAISRLPAAVEHAARRMLLNVVGTAVGAIASGEVNSLIALGEEFGGTATVALPGDRRSLDRRHAALVIGSAAHAEDFDDTHLRSIVHPASSALGAVYALADGTTSGAELLLAFAMSCELQIRMALCLEVPVREFHPASFTGLFGTVGAALAASRLLRLDAGTTLQAMAFACGSSIGSRQSLGSFAKPLHAGKAASSGMAAAQLAATGGWAPIEDPLTGPTGLFNVHFDGRVDLGPLLDGLGEHWEIADTAFKPYPCGVLLHPIIDAALAVRGRVGDLGRIERIDMACNPAAAKDTAVADPKDSHQAKFSGSHAVAAALVDGVLGRRQYQSARVLDPRISALRRRIGFYPDAAIPKDACTVTVHLADGGVLVETVAHAVGSRDRPMTDGELLGKVAQLFEDALPGRAEAVWSAIGALSADTSSAGLREALRP